MLKKGKILQVFCSRWKITGLRKCRNRWRVRGWRGWMTSMTRLFYLVSDAFDRKPGWKFCVHDGLDYVPGVWIENLEGLDWVWGGLDWKPALIYYTHGVLITCTGGLDRMWGGLDWVWGAWFLLFDLLILSFASPSYPSPKGEGSRHGLSLLFCEVWGVVGCGRSCSTWKVE